MRITACLLVAVAAASSWAQVWEKRLAPGLTYRMQVSQSPMKRIVHALRFSPGSPSVKASAELAGGAVYAANDSQGRETVSEMVARTGAIAGINGDFFPFTGDPIGAMVRANELISPPTTRMPRGVFGWGDKSAEVGIVSFRGSFSVDGGQAVLLDSVNESCGPNRINLNTGAAGLAICKGACVQVVLRMDAATWSPNSVNTGTVESFADTEKVPVQEGKAILSACGDKTSVLSGLREGQKVAIKFESQGLNWKNISQAIGGGPFLVRQGHIAVDADVQKFDSAFVEKRHPRSAIGRTADGDIWLVAVEGRLETSDGATLDELAKLMQELGCVDALNLDGGGSTALNAFGLTLNRPSDGKERPVANGVLFFGPKPDPSAGTYTIVGPESIEAGYNLTLSVKDSAGIPIDNADVLWAASGRSAWIDQGGQLHATDPGKVTVTAAVRGTFVTREIAIEAAKPKPPVIKKEPPARQSRPASKTSRSIVRKPATNNASQKRTAARKAVPARKTTRRRG